MTDTGTDRRPPSTLAEDASPEFRAVAESLMESMRSNRVPGAALGILADGREEHATFGVISANTKLPAGPETLFQIGSLTKAYTAAAIWHLVDHGTLAVEAPVRTYIPDLQLDDEATAAHVTVGNLLDHTAGWYGDDTTFTGEDDEAIGRFVRDRLPRLPQLFPLGRFFSYNNAAFILLGRLIEVATGTHYDAAMRNLVFDPLGLTDTVLDRREVLQRQYSDERQSVTATSAPWYRDARESRWHPRRSGRGAAIDTDDMRACTDRRRVGRRPGFLHYRPTGQRVPLR